MTEAFLPINSNDLFYSLKEKEDALLAYFSTYNCSVCNALLPKIATILETNFPKISSCFIQIEKMPELAANNNVFAAPTVLFFFEGKEYIRKSSNFSINELSSEIERIYSRIFL